MPTQIEARRLSGVDIGKTVTGFGRKNRPFSFKLRLINHAENHVMLWATFVDEEPSKCMSLAPNDTVTITGIPSPIVGPDCRDGKCRACYGGAYDEATDQIITCQCTCHN